MEHGTMKPESNPCNGCGKNTSEKKIDENGLCPECAAVIETLTKNPALLRRVPALLQKDHCAGMADAGKSEQPEPRDLPEVLDAVRFRTRDRELNTWYVSVSELEGNPVEIFASTAFDRDQHLQSRISNLTTITRLISLILRHVFLGEVITLEKTLKQMHRSSRQKNDLPDMLARVLCNYCKKPYEFDA